MMSTLSVDTLDSNSSSSSSSSSKPSPITRRTSPTPEQQTGHLEFFRAKVIATKQATPTVREVELQVPSEVEFRYKPGQWIDFKIPPKCENDDTVPNKICGFSLTSSGFSDTSKISIAAKRTKDPVTQYIHERLHVGEDVLVRGPGGLIYYDDEESNDGAVEHVVCIAGGIGITPLMGIMRYIYEKQQWIRERRFASSDDDQQQLPPIANQCVTLLYSIKNEAEAIFHDELLRMQETNPNFRVIITVTQSSSSSSSQQQQQQQQHQHQRQQKRQQAGNDDSDEELSNSSHSNTRYNTSKQLLLQPLPPAEEAEEEPMTQQQQQPQQPRASKAFFRKGRIDREFLREHLCHLSEHPNKRKTTSRSITTTSTSTTTTTTQQQQQQQQQRGKALYFLCGPPAMIKAISPLLRELEGSETEEHIRYDRWW